MTQMKTIKRTEGPDISAIVDGLTGDRTSTPSQSRQSVKDEPVSPSSSSIDYETQGRLWDEFMDCLNDPEEEPTERTKLYAIDDDIVETLHQCNFAKPNVSVINSILRTFLVDNIDRLRKMHRPRSRSLLDKY